MRWHPLDIHQFHFTRCLFFSAFALFCCFSSLSAGIIYLFYFLIKCRTQCHYLGILKSVQLGSSSNFLATPRSHISRQNLAGNFQHWILGERTLPFHLPPLPHFPLYNICNFSFRIKFVFSGFVFYNALAALICSFNGSAVENFALTSVRQACVAHAISQAGSQSLSEYFQENFLRMPSSSPFLVQKPQKFCRLAFVVALPCCLIAHA